MNTTTIAPASRLPVALRIGAAVFGGYAFCWGFIALAMAGLYGLGMKFHDAEHLASILGLLIYLVVFCWAFVTRSVARAWIVLAGGGAAMAAAASLLQHAIVS